MILAKGKTLQGFIKILQGMPACSGYRHRWYIWQISWLWRQFGKGVDVDEKISMNEDNSRCAICDSFSITDCLG
jgi:hypothetical protein